MFQICLVNAQEQEEMVIVLWINHISHVATLQDFAQSSFGQVILSEELIQISQSKVNYAFQNGWGDPNHHKSRMWQINDMRVIQKDFTKNVSLLSSYVNIYFMPNHIRMEYRKEDLEVTRQGGRIHLRLFGNHVWFLSVISTWQGTLQHVPQPWWNSVETWRLCTICGSGCQPKYAKQSCQGLPKHSHDDSSKKSLVNFSSIVKRGTLN